VPVIPIYFSGHNSWRFILIGLIHPILRTAFIPAELTNKKGKQIRLRIGEPISVEEQKHYKDPQDFGRFLYRKTYELKNV
jgi:putative hemolysin